MLGVLLICRWKKFAPTVSRRGPLFHVADVLSPVRYSLGCEPSVEQAACQHKVTRLVVIACLCPPGQIRPEACLEAIVAFIIYI